MELFWGLGTPVVLESTFLQLFLRHLGASSLVIGLVPTFFFVGLSLSSILSGLLTAHLRHKKTALILIHIAGSLPMLILGILLRILGFTPSTLLVFFILYALLSIGIGLIMPTWQNYLVKIFTPQRVIAAHSIMRITQSIGKIISTYFIVRIVSRYSFSVQGSSLVFTLVGSTFLLGSFWFLMTKEFSDPTSETPSSRTATFRRDFRAVFRNRNFLFFLTSDLEQVAVIGVISFYANYATEFCGIDPALVAGLFMAFHYLGNIGATAVLGWVSLLSLKNKYLLAKGLGLVAIVLICLFTTLWIFLLVSFLFGCSRGTRNLVFAPAVKQMTGQSDTTTFFSLAPILVLPFSAGIPLLNGYFLDRFAAGGGNSYRWMFLGMFILAIVGTVFLLKTKFIPPRISSDLNQKGD